MHRKKILGTLLLLFAIVITSVAADISFKASAPSTIVVGNQFRLVYSLNADGDNLRVPPMSDFRLLAGPSVSSSSSITMINGVVTNNSLYSYTYVFLAEKEGNFSIPSATIKVKGKEYTSNSISIEVLPADKAAARAQSGSSGSQAGSASSSDFGITNEDVFARVILSKSTLHQQEATIATVKLFYRINIAEIDPTNSKYPDFKGFLSYNIDMADEERYGVENIGGKNYKTFTVSKSILFPQYAGEITIDPAKIVTVVQVRSSQSTGGIFDDFFGSSYQNVRKQITSNAPKVSVKAFPSGLPSGFSGLSGRFTMSSQIDKTSVTANDAITLKITIGGSGNLKMINTPAINFPKDFEIYDPKVTNNFNYSANGVSGSKIIEYLIIPRFGGTFTIPSYKFSYWDVDAQQIRTLETQSYTLNVAKGSGGDNSQVSSTTFANKEQVKFIGQDIRYIKPKTSLQRVDTFFYGSTGFWIGYILSLIAFFSIWFIYRKKLKENSDIAFKRNKRANALAIKRLKKAEQLMRANDKEHFYQEVLSAIWGYSVDKFNIPLSELTKDKILDILASKQVDQTLVDLFKTVVENCEYARYAPSAISESIEEIYNHAVSLISRLESQIKR